MVALSLFRRPQPQAADEGRIGIIDIGSNSVRLVVYDGQSRMPAILFNEKVMAGLGKSLSTSGAIDAAAMERTMAALSRFGAVARHMQVGTMRVVATAAVRDASNGQEMLDRIRALGLEVELLPGDMEAEMAAQGVLAGIPGAEGVVGDLGGGSLELVRIAGGVTRERISLPLGVLRLGAIRAKGPRALDNRVAKALEAAGWEGIGAGMPFYLVGGSWRALARLDMHRTHYPLPIVHQYHMAAETAATLVRTLAQLDRRRLKQVPSLSTGRIPTLQDAAALLAILARRLHSSELIVSAYGLREGLLHAALPEDVRAEDPLISGARKEGAIQGRFPEHGDILHRWIAPLFAEEGADDARLRHAACLMADVGWRAHPEFRAERGLEMALHGNWAGVDARGRALIAQALYASFGGAGSPEILGRLAEPAGLMQAFRWGLAIRLGQRLSGGAAQGLECSGVSLTETGLCLHLAQGDEPLYGEAVERRHKALASAFGKAPERAG